MKPTTATDGRPRVLYIVSIHKFVLLYLMTGGGYLFYWSYLNWMSYKKASGVAITPMARGLFWPFCILSLFEKVQHELDRQGLSCRWHPEIRGLLIMLMVMTSVLTFTFFSRPLDTPYVLLANGVLILSSVCLFIGAQRAINLLSGDPTGRGNCSFSLANLAWMGAVSFGLVLVTYRAFVLDV